MVCWHLFRNICYCTEFSFLILYLQGGGSTENGAPVEEVESEQKATDRSSSGSTEVDANIHYQLPQIQTICKLS